MVGIGAVSRVCTNSCDRVRDVLILGTVYSDIFSVSLFFFFSLASCTDTFLFILPHVYFATPVTASVPYAYVYQVIPPNIRIWYKQSKREREEKEIVELLAVKYTRLLFIDCNYFRIFDILAENKRYTFYF